MDTDLKSTATDLMLACNRISSTRFGNSPGMSTNIRAVQQRIRTKSKNSNSSSSHKASYCQKSLSELSNGNDERGVLQKANEEVGAAISGGSDAFAVTIPISKLQQSVSTSSLQITWKCCTVWFTE